MPFGIFDHQTHAKQIQHHRTHLISLDFPLLLFENSDYSKSFFGS
jgi:hypothetical protein